MLPGIDIQFQNGNLQLVEPSADGVFGVVASGVSTLDIGYNDPVSVRSMQDVSNLGIVDDVDNHHLFKFLVDFYKNAPSGSKIWIFLIKRGELMSDQFTYNPSYEGTPVKTLLDAANGEISGLFTVWTPDNTVDLSNVNGFDNDVWNTRNEAQDFVHDYLAEKKVPVWVVIEGYNLTKPASDLPDLNEGATNSIQIFVGANEEDIMNCSLGAYAGRLAVSKVSQNPGRKKAGPVYDTQCWIRDKKVETYDIDTLHDKGYVTFRRHPKTSGYFITDCPMACDSTTDYGKLTRRRTINKAFVLAYAEASKEILEDFNLTPAGTIDPIYAGLIESNLKDVIYNSMTLNGELSADPQNDLDKGCEFKIDLNYPTGSTGQIKFSVAQVRVRGYAEMITIPLGFAPFNS